MPPLRVECEQTPNPNALKFIVDRPPTDGGTLSFRDPSEAAEHPLSKAIFALGPVTSVMLTAGFVTVNKTPSARWPTLRPKVEACLRQHLGDSDDPGDN